MTWHLSNALLGAIAIILCSSATLADDVGYLKSCHNSGTQFYCHKNRFNCDDPAVKWICQRACDVRKYLSLLYFFV